MAAWTPEGRPPLLAERTQGLVPPFCCCVTVVSVLLCGLTHLRFVDGIYPHRCRGGGGGWWGCRDRMRSADWRQHSIPGAGQGGVNKPGPGRGCTCAARVTARARAWCGAAPLDWRAWEAALAAHPDRRFADYITQCVREGFCITPAGARARAATCGQPLNIRRRSTGTSRTNAARGPFPPSSVPQVHVSRLGVVPKKWIDKWHLILDLSSPEGRSVNDGIRPELCSLSYVAVDNAARMVTRAGQGALLAKVDIKSAYRLVPVHPEDRLLLGMAWDGAVFVDTILPFGLRSAPKIFTARCSRVDHPVPRGPGSSPLPRRLSDCWST